MASPPPSTSPQWDNRNRGFIPPSQLQQMRLHSPNRELTSSPASEPMASSSSQLPSRPPPGGQGSHGRSSSFFSFLGSKSTDSQSSSPQFSSLQARRRSLQPGADEQGRMSSDKSRQSVSSPLSPPQIRSSPNAPPPERRTSLTATAAPPGPNGQQPLHPEIRSAVQLTLAHAHKVYFSGPMVRRIERLPDGHQPAKDEGWRDVWAQLGGTTLSVWDMKEIEEASKMGREVPPTYINITDAFVNVLGAVTIPAIGSNPPRKYSNVVTVNSAGSNLLLFSCPSTSALISWATALRLASWEKSRLEEIYTAHLIRIMLNDGRDIPSTLIRNRMEGWVRVRMAGQTDWKRLWMVISSGSSQEALGSPNYSDAPGTPEFPRRKRLSSLFSSKEDSHGHLQHSRSIVSFYMSQKSKDRRRPILAFQDVSQAFAVYPERPELINRSTLIKLEGTFGDEEIAGPMRGKEGWVLVMPELEPGLGQANEMLKWLIALHDAFQLYGRPKEYSWDPRDPSSMMFAYPIGPNRDLLFLEREMAETMDPRDDRTSAVRSRLLNILLERMQGATPHRGNSLPLKLSVAPTLPPLPSLSESEPESGGGSAQPSGALPQLPALNFGASSSGDGAAAEPARRILTPITEGSPDGRPSDPSRSMSGGGGSTTRSPLGTGPYAVTEEPRENGAVLDRPVNTSPTPMSSPSLSPLSPVRRLSDDSSKNVNVSRPSSRPGHSFTGSMSNARQSTEEHTSHNATNITSTVSTGTDSSLATSVPPLSTTASSNPPPSTNPGPPRTPSPGFSILTSPHSPTDGPRSAEYRSFAAASIRAPSIHAPSIHAPSVHAPSILAASILTSPHSPIEGPTRPAPFADPSERFVRSPGTPPITARAPLPPSRLSTTPAYPSKEEEPEGNDDLYAEAGALYYMQQFDSQDVAPRRLLPSHDEDETSSDESSEEPSIPPPPPAVQTKNIQPHHSRTNSPAAQNTQVRAGGARSPPGPGSRPMGWKASRTASLSKSLTAESGPDRRPYGARAAPGGSRHDTLGVHSPELFSSVEDASDIHRRQDMLAHDDDPNADALAALTFLEQDDHAPPAQSAAKPASSPPPMSATSQPPSIVDPEDRSGTPESDSQSQYKSSFAPSKTAMQRKAKTEAQQAAHEAASHRPGRAGKSKTKAKHRGAWGDSSDDEEEEEEEEEEDVDSDGEPAAPVRDDHSVSGYSRQGGQPQAPYPPPLAGTDSSQSQHSRPPRNLPQVPAPRSQADYESDGQRRPYPDQYPQMDRRTAYDESLHPSSASFSAIPTHAPAPVPPRHMWSQVLDPDRAKGTIPDSGRDTFVQLESPAATMTKAFTPHGLLSAGLQDKEDRSAKKQEELARESGASLVNVPNKPPPPQTGLLGAITAHERERKREGGVGATLTEREREKRLAEERQRKLDEYQRQQLEQMAQGGSMYSAQQFPGYNPMMNPMMMGMNPMMTGYMGYPGMMPGYGNPQHMFAAQQAAQAYQQAMMSLSQAGSQVGGEAGGGPAPLNPMMTGASMAGFDARFSMMMPMMSPMGAMGGMGGQMGAMGGQMGGGMGQMGAGLGQMGSGMGGQMGGPMGGMGGGMSPMPMNMQMTGGSPSFDPRLSQFDPGLQPPSTDFAGQGQGRFTSNNSSAGRNSPGRRPVDATDEPPRRSADTSPRPPQ